MFIFIKTRCYIHLCSLYLIFTETNGAGGFPGAAPGHEPDAGGPDPPEPVQGCRVPGQDGDHRPGTPGDEEGPQRGREEDQCKPFKHLENGSNTVKEIDLLSNGLYVHTYLKLT